jgi:hypothetical protein
MYKSAIEAVEAEIQKEKAESPGRTGERLDQTLGEIRALREQLFALTEERLNETKADQVIPPEIQEGLARHAELCALARDIRYQLIVQREVVGFRRHGDVDRHYPMPARLTLAMLIRREVPR